jgi:hydroxymethylpyrimidine kinase/phosphomethylpyrimidine kinase
MPSVPRILTVAGSDSGGGAGIQADLKTIAVLGGFGASVITALTAQNTVGVAGIFEVPPDFIAQQFDAVASDIGADAAKTGMLVNPQVVRLVARKVVEHRIPNLVVDPVMLAKSGDPLLSEDARNVILNTLIPLAAVVTPNLPEAALLAGIPVRTPDDMRRAAERIRASGVQHVLVKGGHLKGQALDLLYDGRDFVELSAERIDTQNTHGTGCVYSAAIATLLGHGHPVREAVRQAKAFITTAIRHSLSLGRGHGPANPSAWIAR